MEIKRKNYTFFIDDEDVSILNRYYYWINRNDQKHSTSYIRLREKGTKNETRLHRVILGITDKLILIDHIDGNGLNNRKVNLRICTPQQNHFNQPMRSNNKTGYKGVYIRKINKKNKTYEYYSAQIGFNGTKYLGIFKNKIDAARTYNLAAIRYFGKFAKLNEINSLCT